MKTSHQEIRTLVNDVATTAQDIFNDACTAVYIMGSLARGGFSEIASDIDLGIILNRPPQKSDNLAIDEIQSIARSKHPTVENSISIFWGSVESINGVIDSGRYPPFDRLDLIDYALLLTGTEIRDKLVKPTKKELEIAGAEFALSYLGHQERIEEFSDCQRIVQKGAVYVTKTILFPARFIYLEKTGNIASNDVSYEYYVKNSPAVMPSLCARATNGG